MHKRTISVFLGWSLCAALSGCAHGHGHHFSPSESEGVRVSGVGEASAEPDIVRSRIGIDLRAPTAEQASADASQRMGAVIAALKGLGIAEKDLRTYNYSVSFEETQPQPTPPAPPPPAAKSAAASKAEPPPPAAEPTPRGFYHVSNTLEVTIRDLKTVGHVLQVATTAGANNFWGLDFDLEDDSALITKARAAAVEDARKSAAALAQLAGVQLGEILALNESETPNTNNPPVYAMRAAAVSDVPIERGVITVHYGVDVLYGLRHHHEDHDD